MELGTLVQERLTSLMNEAASSRDMQTRRDAWSYFQKSRPAWLDGTLKVWQAALQPSKAAPKKNPLDDESDGAFELVGTDVVENKILASRLVLGVTEKVSSQLNDLQVRMRVLTGHDEFEKDDILRPDVLVLKMVEQWGSCGMPRDSWPLVNDVVQTHLSERLKVAYTNANDLLIKQGVLPTIDLKDRVKRGAPVRGSGPGPRPTPPQAGLDSSQPPESSRGVLPGHRRPGELRRSGGRPIRSACCGTGASASTSGFGRGRSGLRRALGLGRRHRGRERRGRVGATAFGWWTAAQRAGQSTGSGRSGALGHF